MAKLNLQLRLFPAATLMIVCSVATAAAMTLEHDSYGQQNMPVATTAMPATTRWQPLQRDGYNKQAYAYVSVTAQPVTKRSSYSSGGLATVLNSLTNLSGLGHISNGYGAVAPTHTEAFSAPSAKQEIPIYEEQHEDADATTVTANSQQQAAIYNFAAAATHNAGFLPAFGSAEHGGWTPAVAAAAEPEQRYAYEKISLGNLMQHYEHNAGYDEEQQQQQQQQQQQHADELEQHHQQHAEQSHGIDHPEYYASAGSGPSAEAHNTNYLGEAGGSSSAQQSHHTEIINYLPYPIVKQQHVPYERHIKIPVSHAVIVPVRKPVPIHIPVPKQVTVEVEQQLKIPVERVVPYPVEKHVPVQVEKRVPYQVIKYMPIKVPKPFPVKVPVFKTVLHKVKGGWW